MANHYEGSVLESGAKNVWRRLDGGMVKKKFKGWDSKVVWQSCSKNTFCGVAKNFSSWLTKSVLGTGESQKNFEG